MVTRRQLLLAAGTAGGSAAVLRLAQALELLPTLADGPALSLAPARGVRRVVILGAGIAGLIAGLELTRAGYRVEILEAAHRPGGRVLTLRGGDVVDEIGNRQLCRFDRDPQLYFNAGASRIPAVHRRILDYCRQLGVLLETHVNLNTSAWLQYDNAFGGQRVRQREFNADARGFLAELLAKSISPQSLDAPLTAEDTQRLMDFVSRFGDLDAERRYRGSGGRAGFRSGGLYMHGESLPVRDAAQLLRADYWQSAMHFAESVAQSSVLQPVGGMDRIVQALLAQLPGALHLETQVIDIRTSEREVTITCRDRAGTRTITADWCLDSIPGQLLAGIDNNFSREYRARLAARPRGKLAKIAFQMRERFWEREGIYGGISWTGQDIGQIQYPSHAFHAGKGILVGGYYLQPGPADRFHVMSAAERHEAAIAQGEKLHPGYRQQVENGVSVAWYRMNHMLGCTARDTDEETLAILRRNEGRHLLIGDQVSAHAGWQEAAVLSAHAALNRLSTMEADRAA